MPLVCTLGGLAVGFALTGTKADERQTLRGILAADPTLAAERASQILIGDKNYFSTDFEATLPACGLDLLRPARKGKTPHLGTRLFKPLQVGPVEPHPRGEPDSAPDAIQRCGVSRWPAGGGPGWFNHPRIEHKFEH